MLSTSWAFDNKESIPSEILSTKWAFDNHHNHNNKEHTPSKMSSTKWAFNNYNHNNKEYNHLWFSWSAFCGLGVTPSYSSLGYV